MHSLHADDFCGFWPARDHQQTHEVWLAHGSPPDSLEETLVVAKVGQYHGRDNLGATPGLTPGCHLHPAFIHEPAAGARPRMA